MLKGETKHELACSACGAPLHNLKHMPVPQEPVRKAKHQPSFAHAPKKKKKSKQKYKKRKSLFSEAFDILEDIFD